MFIDFREREGVGGGVEREKESYIDVRNIDQLPPVRIPTGDGTHNLLVYKTTFQLSHLARAQILTFDSPKT